MNGGPKMKYISIFFLLLNITGCQKELPEPEVKFQVVPMSTINTEHDLPVAIEQGREPFMVQHHVKGDNVFVECMIPNISFREDSKNKGKIILMIDGKKREEIHTAAFIIKGLGRGTHQISLEVVTPNNEPYHLKKEFAVSVQ